MGRVCPWIETDRSDRVREIILRERVARRWRLFQGWEPGGGGAETLINTDGQDQIASD